MEHSCRYLIIGASLAGVSAIKGIRAHDALGSILLVGQELHMPYHRPPLTKDLWFGKKQLADIYIKKMEYYLEQQVGVVPGTHITRLDAEAHRAEDAHGNSYRYEKALLATGGTPRRLDIPGGDLEGIYYYRTLDHYQSLRAEAHPGMSAIIVGGGFIGSELAAALCLAGIQVTMIFPEPYLVSRVFPEELGRSLQAQYRQRGINIIAEDLPATIMREGKVFHMQTRQGARLGADMFIVGAGILPNVALAQQAGAAIGNGIEVDEFFRTSHADLFAAGDNAHFPYAALGEKMRVEHWNHAMKSGDCAGRNMAGAEAPYDYLPYFFSDLFDFGYEAVGDINTELETFADWEDEQKAGVIYYLRDGRVRGVMTCNIFGKMDAARALIQNGSPVSREDLRGMIQSKEEQAG